MKKKCIAAIIACGIGFAAQAEITLGNTAENLRIDLEAADDFGARPVSRGADEYLNTQGAIVLTGNQFDLAIHGYGFFAVTYGDSLGPQGARFTRYGRFTLKDGQLRTEDGGTLCIYQNELECLIQNPSQSLTLRLYYPAYATEITVLDSRGWTSNRPCVEVAGRVIVGALEQCPTDALETAKRLAELTAKEASAE